MAERQFPGFILRTLVVKEGSRFTTLISSHPEGRGFPSYFAVCENRSFRDEGVAAEAVEKALGLVLGVEEDGTPVFAEGETGFDDDRPGESAETTHDAD
ncbi:MAG: hypothetical protein GAK28_04121 [Luteibacter sp.]|uniref:hypothetical protein n=1 Tax=Luteibacter sp. TaxID=1886636 RepID=UPI00137D988B|nr:hypothetical protein [Luteibacter sp.]KAF1004260.1 MAG: hypothetical protein GAK28_04121 [Luteibacter sp.]